MLKAVILAAGQGSRLRPLTDHCPKCLVEVHGKAILEWALRGLSESGIKDVLIAVGYQADRIIERYGDSYLGMSIGYVNNPDFATTNNLYSFWLTKPFLDDNIILMEGDILFDTEIITNLIEHPGADVMVADPFQEHMDGTTVFIENNMVTELTLKRNQPQDFNFNKAYKTININKFSRELLVPYLQNVKRWVDKGLTNDYYEAALGELIAEQHVPVVAMGVGEARWAETDTVEDLRLAEQIFSDWADRE